MMAYMLLSTCENDYSTTHTVPPLTIRPTATIAWRLSSLTQTPPTPLISYSSSSNDGFDIGANLTDPVFRGVYRGKAAHPDDFEHVLKRACDVGVQKIIVTGGSLRDCKKAMDLVKGNDHLVTTVGCHPTRCSEFETTKNTTPDEYLHNLSQLIISNPGKVAAIGEFGLDYDRLQFCEKDCQKKYFERQFGLCERYRLPLFLHCRNAYDDFFDILHRNRGKFDQGVVHSFTGNASEANRILEFGLYIGINGCSMKTSENLEAIKTIPCDRILIETDAPWCEIRPTHASYKMVKSHFTSKKKEKWELGCSVKSRNEPQNIIQVLEVLSSLYGMDLHELSEIIYKNTCSIFRLKE